MQCWWRRVCGNPWYRGRPGGDPWYRGFRVPDALLRGEEGAAPQRPPRHGEFYAALQDTRGRLAKDLAATQGEVQQLRQTLQRMGSVL
eukprot:6483087-Alexandrium_andersonii.AAC.1